MDIFINQKGKTPIKMSLEEFLKLANQPNGGLARAGFSANATASVIGDGRLSDGLHFPNRIKMEAYSPVDVGGESIGMKRIKAISRGDTLNEKDGCLVGAVQQMVVNEGLPEIMKEHLKWGEETDNMVVNVGLQHILDILFVSATAQIDPWYVGLITDNSAAFDVLPADTMASHSTWSEDTTYSDGTRPAYIDVRTLQSVDNSGTTADFSINGTTIIAGAFMASSSTKGETASTLLCGGVFTGGERSVINGDTLQVTYTFTAADDGV
jgi:hypothetical protein